MATYKEVIGTSITNIAGDSPTTVDGDVWYNSSATNFKFNLTSSFTGWTTGGNLTTARQLLAGAGTQTAGLAFGGGPGVKNETEEYGGTSWTNGGNLTTARNSLAGCGTQTAGLAFGGREPAMSDATEEYNGSSWTNGGNLTTARRSLAGCGTQTAGLGFGGYVPGARQNATEEYNGSSITNGS
jgi:hypothetical protein